MDYSHYTTVRNLSWNCLIECNVQALPVSLSKICRHYGYTIIRNSGLPVGSEFALKPNERGRNVITDNKIFIIVRDTDNIAAQRYSIAHEIGHILLKHNCQKDISQENENETERFAIDLLAPACVLWGLNLHTPEEIAKACNISITSAKLRSERMEILYKRNKFLLHPLERQLYKQFESFINEHSKRQ